MCGIAGYVQRASSDIDAIERMTQRLAHRGPDGSGVWRGRFGDWTVALGHRRLSIIDREGGAQPLSDGSAWITYNGEVYNFNRLRGDLESLGESFATRSDTEVVLRCWHSFGEDGVRRLEGMFAFAIWDHRLGRLLLARDRIGIKPLYYALLADGGIAFASELSALLQHPNVDRQLDADGLTSLFFLDYIQPPHTIVRGARKLEPAHLLTWSAGRASAPRAYWKLNLSDRAPDDAVIPELRRRLDDAVHRQMVSDVPIGVFLSGGIDSSLVAAIAQQHADHRLKTFSFAFDDPQFDESRHARLVADHIGSDHHQRTLCERTLLETLDHALQCLDEPIGDPSIVPTFLLSKLASEYVKVALGGDGADELWAGYPTYIAHKFASIYQRLPRAAREHFVKPLIRSLPVAHGYQRLEWKAKRFVLRWDDRPAIRHLRWMSNTDFPELYRCLSDMDALPEGIARLIAEPLAADQLNQVLATDVMSYLPGAVLTKVDRASMAHGLEVRPPMLDEQLVEFAFSLPASLKLSGRTTKSALKRAARGLLPDAIIDRKKKGFAIPLAKWLNGPLRTRVVETLESGLIWQTGMLNRATFRSWQREHEARRMDRSKPLWAMVVLENWYQRVMR